MNLKITGKTQLIVLSTITLFMSSVSANYDSSTTSVKVDKPKMGLAAISTITFPGISAATVMEGMQEASDYATATSQRFRYTIEDISAKRKGSFYFTGGSLEALSSYLGTLGLFADIKQGNRLTISSTKYFSEPIEARYASSVKKSLKKTKEISNVSYTNGNIHFVANKKTYPVAMSAIATNTIPSQQNIVTNVTNVTNVPNVPHVENPGYPNAVGNGYNSNTVVVVRGKGIGLTKPYTIKTFLRKLGRETGKVYDVQVDTNIPVDKSVRINGVDDLNAYLKKTTGQSFIIKKTKTGTIIVE